MLYYLLVVAFGIPLLIMTYAYVKTGIVLYKSISEAKAMIGLTDRYILPLSNNPRLQYNRIVSMNSLCLATRQPSCHGNRKQKYNFI